jgi:hypothetical protein
VDKTGTVLLWYDKDDRPAVDNFGRIDDDPILFFLLPHGSMSRMLFPHVATRISALIRCCRPAVRCQTYEIYELSMFSGEVGGNRKYSNFMGS